MLLTARYVTAGLLQQVGDDGSPLLRVVVELLPVPLMGHDGRADLADRARPGHIAAGRTRRGPHHGLRDPGQWSERTMIGR